MPRAAEGLLFLVIPREDCDDQLSESTAHPIIEPETAFSSGSCSGLDDFQYGRVVNPGTVVSEGRVGVCRFSKDL